MNNTDNFINLETFATLIGCVLITTLCTEAFKSVMPQFYSQWVALAFAVLISIARFFLIGDYDLKAIILAIINVIPIFLGAIGTYEVVLKSVRNLLGSN